jgi:Flp pilus assembly protein TadB
MEKAFGKRSLMANGLVRLEKALSAHMPLSEALEDFCRKLDFIEILPIFHALAISRIVGNGVISILRNSCQMLSELIAVNSEVEANNAGRNAEAFVLCVMPFGITYALSGFSDGYMDSAHSSSTGIGLMLVAFATAVISCGFLLSLIGGKKKIRIEQRSSSNTFKFPDRFIQKIRAVISRIIPEGTLTRQFELYSELSNNPDQFFIIQINRTIQLVILTIPLFTILFLLSGASMLFLVPAEFGIIVLTQFDLRGRAAERREKLMEEIPLFLSMLVTLINSGVLLPKAIDICSKAFSEKTHLGNEIRIMKAQMLSGLSAGRTLESFSERTPLPEAQAALLLAARYEVTGGSEVLQLLSLQSSACWSLCRNASRKRREREALGMVFPMMLDLVSVLLVAITPALLSLKTF